MGQLKDNRLWRRLPGNDFAQMSKKQAPIPVIWACPAPTLVEPPQGPQGFLVAGTAS